MEPTDRFDILSNSYLGSLWLSSRGNKSKVYRLVASTEIYRVAQKSTYIKHYICFIYNQNKALALWCESVRRTMSLCKF